MASKLQYPDQHTLSSDAKLLLASRPQRNMYRMLAHAPSTLPSVLDLTRALLHDSVLPPKLRELAILRVGHLCGSAYAVHQHRKIGAAVGLDAARMDATSLDAEAAADAGCSETEVLVLRFVEQVVGQTRADTELRDRIVQALGMEQMMELLVLVGTYAMLARVLENTGVEIEDGGGPCPIEVAQIYGPQASGWTRRRRPAASITTTPGFLPAPSPRSARSRRSVAARNGAF